MPRDLILVVAVLFATAVASAQENSATVPFRCESLAPPFEDIVKRQVAAAPADPFLSPDTSPWAPRLIDLQRLKTAHALSALPKKTEGLPLPAASPDSSDCRNVQGTTFAFGSAVLTVSAGHEPEECGGSPYLVWKDDNGELRSGSLPAVWNWNVREWWCLPDYFVLGLDVSYEGFGSAETIAFWNLKTGKVALYPSIETSAVADSMHLNELNFREFLPEWKLASAGEQDGAILLWRGDVAAAFWPDANAWTVLEASSGKLLPALAAKFREREKPVVPIDTSTFLPAFEKSAGEPKLEVQDLAKIDERLNVVVLYCEASDEFGVFVVDSEGKEVLPVKVFLSPRGHDYLVRVQSASTKEVIVSGAGASYRDSHETWSFDLDIPGKRATERVHQ